MMHKTGISTKLSMRHLLILNALLVNQSRYDSSEPTCGHNTAGDGDTRTVCLRGICNPTWYGLSFHCPSFHSLSFAWRLTIKIVSMDSCKYQISNATPAEPGRAGGSRGISHCISRVSHHKKQNKLMLRIVVIIPQNLAAGCRIKLRAEVLMKSGRLEPQRLQKVLFR